jgi:peptide/nickel transport system substrate-binding protein
MRKARLALTMVAVMALAGAALTACNTSNNKTGKSSSSARAGTLTIANVNGQTWTCGFNPFNPAVQFLTLGFVYEPLVFVNALQNSKETPMLAKSYTWAADKKSITFTVRDGVKWSDGQPMTADDVAFTFNLMKQKPALDLTSLWSTILTDVSATGNTVKMTFKDAAAPYFYYFADQVGIVPKHVWSGADVAKDPVAYQDANPIGTGPFTVKPCTPNNITYLANTSYWQPGLPKVAKIQYPAYTDNPPANLDLANGKAQWGGQYIPGIDKFYVAKNKDQNHYWFPPTNNVGIFFNLKHPVTGNLAVRQAFAYGIDREQVSKIGESGYQPAGNQSGVVLPTYKDWFNADQAKQNDYTMSADKAKQALSSAGYSASKPLKLKIITVTGYTDWDASLNEIKQQLKPLGIEIDVNDLAQTAYQDKLYKGDYDLAYGQETAGPAPYYEFRQWLLSGNSAPLGQNASTNWERYSDPATDKLLNDYAAADEATQKDIVNKLQNVMLTTIPFLPTTEGVSWFQYNTDHWSGWPTPDNPYALPAPYNFPDAEQVLLHLSYK